MQSDFVTPEWVKDAVFYQIFPDRFANSPQTLKPNNLEPWNSAPTVHGFKGGDLLGVLEHLDYLQDLGIDAFYFNPIFQSASNHRYHTHDYFQVDPLLGGNSAFKKLLDEAHRRRMYIVLDGVFNHASRGFFQFNHILETGPSSPYLDWFLIKGFPLNAYEGEPNYQCWWDLPALPEFNMDNHQVWQFIFDVARFWIDQGVDGWRLDVPFCIQDDEFWSEFRQVVKSANPDAYLVGEIPWEAQRWLQGDQFDAVMNYQFTQSCLGFFAGERIDRDVEQGMMGLPPTPLLDAPAFMKRAEELLNLYPRQAVMAQLNLLSSHDMPRFVTLASGDKSALQLATLFKMTYPGAPCIYYGDEIGMQGGKSNYPEPSRAAFIWDESQWDLKLRGNFREYINWRKSYPALRRGDFTTLYAEDQVLAFLRQLGEEKLVVIINAGTASYSVDIPASILAKASLGTNTHWKDLLTDKEAVLTDDRLTGVVLAPRSGSILCPRS